MKSQIKKNLKDTFKTTQLILEPGILTKIGELKITSGIILIGDLGGNFSNKNEALEKFPIGNFPIYYYRHEFASTIVIFDIKKIPVNWKLVKFFNHNLPPLESFEVDSGSFSFVDKDGLIAIDNNQKNKLYPQDFWHDEIFQRYMNNNGARSFDIPIANSNNNLIVTNTEWGDSLYNSYIGIDINGETVCLHTDLGDSKF